MENKFNFSDENSSLKNSDNSISGNAKGLFSSMLSFFKEILDFRNEKYGLLAPNNEEIFPFEFESIMIDNHFSLTNYTVVVG